MTVHLKRWHVLSTLAIVGLSIVSSLLGLFVSGHYTGSSDLLARNQAQDATVLAIGVPALAAGLWLARKGSLPGWPARGRSGDSSSGSDRSPTWSTCGRPTR